MNDLEGKGSLGRDFALPTTIWLGTVFLMLNLKNIPVDFIQDNHVSVRNYLAKFVLTILVPLGLIYAVYQLWGTSVCRYTSIPHLHFGSLYVRYQTDEGTILVGSLFSFRILHAPSNKAKVNRNIVNAERKMATELSSKGVNSNTVFTSRDVPKKAMATMTTLDVRCIKLPPSNSSNCGRNR